MINYKKLYYRLFNEISQVIEDLEAVQSEVEEEYLNQDDKKYLTTLPHSKVDSYEKIRELIAKNNEPIAVYQDDKVQFVVMSKAKFEEMQ